MSEENTPPVEPNASPVEPNEPTSLLEGKVEPAADSWFFAEGMEGVGEKPEWFKGDKYTNVSEQARAYTELEKKFGSFVGAPKEGYELPDGTNTEDELVQELMNFGKNHQMSQEGFNELHKLGMTLAQVKEEVSVEQEIEKIGENASQRIKRVDNFLQNNLDDDKYKEVAPLMVTAETVKLAEVFIGLTGQQQLPLEEVTTTDGKTIDDLIAMTTQKDEHGNLLMNTDARHQAAYAKLKAELESKAA